MEIKMGNNKPNNPILIKTLCNSTINVTDYLNNDSNITLLKEYLCNGKGLHASDITIIANKKELSGVITKEMAKNLNMFVFLKSSASSLMHVKLSNGTIKTFQANTRIIDLKKTLFDEKITDISPYQQRLILNKRILVDHNYLGDYALLSRSVIGSADIVLQIHISKTQVNENYKQKIKFNINNKDSYDFEYTCYSPLFYPLAILFNCNADVLRTCQCTTTNNTYILLSKSLMDYGLVDINNTIIINIQIQSDVRIDYRDVKAWLNLVNSGYSSTTSLPLKKKPVSNKESGTGMFAGMKKGFLNSSSKRQNKASHVKEYTKQLESDIHSSHGDSTSLSVHNEKSRARQMSP
jgi:hypothetical protein